jgi:hypothetical protein
MPNTGQLVKGHAKGLLIRHQRSTKDHVSYFGQSLAPENA